MELILIRHGKTKGNEEKRYIGITDEPLSILGRQELIFYKEQGYYPEVEGLYSSPMMRCRESAALIYPGQHQEIIAEISECSFGEFEGKTYQELKHQPEYIAWIDGNGHPPAGEERQVFGSRVWEGLLTILEDSYKKGIEKAAVVLHGGSLMALMGTLLETPERFYEFQVKNGRGFCLEFSERDLKGEWKLLNFREL